MPMRPEPVGSDRAADAMLLFDAVREAGALALSFTRKGFRQWRKADGTPVTEADIAVDAFLKQVLEGARPGYGWLSEETPDNAARLACERLWIADPIDGTRAFASGRDDWCVAVALIEGDRPVIGAIYRPMRDEFFSAIAGEGAYLDGGRLSIGRESSLDGAHVIGNAAALRMIALKAPVDAVGGSGVPIALRLAGVASQTFSAALSTTPKHDWDLAAGDLLVREAGGVVTTLEGGHLAFNRPEPSQNGYIAASAGRHRALMDILGDR
jgi:myo-inositol-1(or 4)-monophosphatase